MALITIISRIPDGLMLVESTSLNAQTLQSSGSSSITSAAGSKDSALSNRKRKPDPEEDLEGDLSGDDDDDSSSSSNSINSNSLDAQRAQAQKVVRKLTERSPERLVIDAGDHFYYAYLQRDQVCVLAVCENVYPKKLAFEYISELHQEFETRYRAELGAVQQPYAFMKFEGFIQKTQHKFSDTRSQQTLERAAGELRDAHKIMTQSIQEILVRGDKISSVASRSELLASEASKYNKKSKDFELYMLWERRKPLIIGAGLAAIFLILKFFVF